MEQHNLKGGFILQIIDHTQIGIGMNGEHRDGAFLRFIRVRQRR